MGQPQRRLLAAMRIKGHTRRKDDNGCRQRKKEAKNGESPIGTTLETFPQNIIRQGVLNRTVGVGGLHDSSRRCFVFVVLSFFVLQHILALFWIWLL